MVDNAKPTSVTLTTDDGIALQAELADCPDPIANAVVCHPHPLHGGNMFSHVVGKIFNTLVQEQAACIRFNFRGTDGSEGQHGGGTDEAADIKAAVDHLVLLHPDRPVLMAGYSFGADVALANTDERISGWLAVAPPLRVFEPGDMAAGSRAEPKVIITGSGDEFCPPEKAKTLTAAWTNTEVTSIAGGSHFFATGLDEVAEATKALLASLTQS